MKKQILSEEFRRMQVLAGILNESQLNNLEENQNDTITIDGKEVDTNSIEMAGIEPNDAPDYVDAYVDSAKFTDGESLTDDQLDRLKEEYPDFIYDQI